MFPRIRVIIRFLIKISAKADLIFIAVRDLLVLLPCLNLRIFKEIKQTLSDLYFQLSLTLPVLEDKTERALKFKSSFRLSVQIFRHHPFLRLSYLYP